MPRKVLDMPLRERLEAVVFQKVENTLAVQLGDQTRVVAIVEILV
jgi:hypothetical protein